MITDAMIEAAIAATPTPMQIDTGDRVAYATMIAAILLAQITGEGRDACPRCGAVSQLESYYCGSCRQFMGAR